MVSRGRKTVQLFIFLIVVILVQLILFFKIYTSFSTSQSEHVEYEGLYAIGLPLQL